MIYRPTTCVNFNFLNCIQNSQTFDWTIRFLQFLQHMFRISPAIGLILNYVNPIDSLQDIKGFFIYFFQTATFQSRSKCIQPFPNFD